MRINAINVTNNYRAKLSAAKKITRFNESETPKIQSNNTVPVFNGKGRLLGGLLGGTVGTLAGIGLGTIITIGTGGLAAPLIAGMAGCALGSAGGSEAGAKLDNDPKDDPWDGGNGSGDYYP